MEKRDLSEEEPEETQAQQHEVMGKLAYDAYQQSKYASHLNHITPWSELPDFWQRDWIVAAQAVAGYVVEVTEKMLKEASE